MRRPRCPAMIIVRPEKNGAPLVIAWGSRPGSGLRWMENCGQREPCGEAAWLAPDPLAVFGVVGELRGRDPHCLQRVVQCQGERHATDAAACDRHTHEDRRPAAL